jgi:hypothetical protein
MTAHRSHLTSGSHSSPLTHAARRPQPDFQFAKVVAPRYDFRPAAETVSIGRSPTREGNTA